MLSSTGMENINIVLCRYCKTSNEVLVKLKNIFVKLDILCNYMHHPSTFSISYDEAITDCQIDQTYNSFCKYALGISKYTSSTFKLRELSKFPLSHTAIVIALPYWLRMEHETENVLLNKAFNTMERENHPRLQNLYFFVCVCVCVCVFVYKRHNFFLFKKYILHVLVISGTRS